MRYATGVGDEPIARANILLVDDQPANLVVLKSTLADLGQNLVTANSGEEALRLLFQEDFAVVLLDVQMQGLDGFATAQIVRSRERTRHTPIIFLDGLRHHRFPSGPSLRPRRGRLPCQTARAGNPPGKDGRFRGLIP